eukprot:1075696-Pelagomonas_calceolata.AAC.7
MEAAVCTPGVSTQAHEAAGSSRTWLLLQNMDQAKSVLLQLETRFRASLICRYDPSDTAQATAGAHIALSCILLLHSSGEAVP